MTLLLVPPGRPNGVLDWLFLRHVGLDPLLELGVRWMFIGLPKDPPVAPPRDTQEKTWLEMTVARADVVNSMLLPVASK